MFQESLHDKRNKTKYARKMPLYLSWPDHGCKPPRQQNTTGVKCTQIFCHRYSSITCSNGNTLEWQGAYEVNKRCKHGHQILQAGSYICQAESFAWADGQTTYPHADSTAALQIKFIKAHWKACKCCFPSSPPRPSPFPFWRGQQLIVRVSKEITCQFYATFKRQQCVEIIGVNKSGTTDRRLVQSHRYLRL